MTEDQIAGADAPIQIVGANAPVQTTVTAISAPMTAAVEVKPLPVYTRDPRLPCMRVHYRCRQLISGARCAGGAATGLRAPYLCQRFAGPHAGASFQRASDSRDGGTGSCAGCLLSTRPCVPVPKVQASDKAVPSSQAALPDAGRATEHGERRAGRGSVLSDQHVPGRRRGGTPPAQAVFLLLHVKLLRSGS